MHKYKDSVGTYDNNCPMSTDNLILDSV